MVGYEQLAQALEQASGGRFEAGEITPSPSASRAGAIALLSEVLATLERTQTAPGVFSSTDDRTASLVQSFLAKRAAAKLEVVPQADRGLEAKFDSKDVLGWAGSLLDWVGGINKHAFVDSGGSPLSLPADARVAILSDWGTGMYGGPECAKSIAKDGKFDLLLHLGDVYYSGTPEEVEARFLSFWPKVATALNRALNSNHEMYSGGHGYFEGILKKFQQPSSYFAFQNEHWLLAGLDTGYEEHELHGEQAEWLIDLVNGAGDRRVVLFSHHQPYSLYEKQGYRLVGQLGKLLDRRKIHSWYWGHEHRCVVYEPHEQWGVRGRCVGHSAFPYFRDRFDAPLSAPGWQQVPGRNLVPGARVLDGPNIYVQGKAPQYGPNGYVVLEFNDRDLRERFMNPDGTELPLSMS
jgi:hypothetical protein